MLQMWAATKGLGLRWVGKVLLAVAVLYCATRLNIQPSLLRPFVAAHVWSISGLQQLSLTAACILCMLIWLEQNIVQYILGHRVRLWLKAGSPLERTFAMRDHGWPILNQEHWHHLLLLLGGRQLILKEFCNVSMHGAPCMHFEHPDLHEVPNVL